MVRTSTIVIALLFAVGLVVAMLPAQDAARRRVSVYAGVSDLEGADQAPAPEPGLIPVDEGTSPARLEAQPATSPPSAYAPADQGVSPAGVFGRNRREGESSVTSQFEASTQSISQEYTPSPAEVSPPAEAVPMPAEAAPQDAADSAAQQTPTRSKRGRRFTHKSKETDTSAMYDNPGCGPVQ